MKRFELSEDFMAQMTVQQLKTQLNQFGMTPQQMFDQMELTSQADEGRRFSRNSNILI